jgi:beta-glucosidase
MSFKKGFVWGVSTAAYQIEGAAYEDGKGLSVWDMYAKTPDKVFKGHTGDTACDHYHRLEEDLQLLKDSGVNSYRFSISWPRILPDGIGEVNEKGVEFYNRLIDGLLAIGITPYVTIFHWDYPYELYKQGGWMNPECSDWFAYYTDVLTKRFGDRVKHWFTLNEPQIFIGMGHQTGRHAPGHKHSEFDIAVMVHNVLLAHGKAVKTIRSNVANSVVGYAPAGFPSIPETSSPEDIEMARKITFAEGQKDSSFLKKHHMPLGLTEVLWIDPVYLGKYPEWFIKDFGHMLPSTWEEDLSIISQPIDMCAVNLYQGSYVSDLSGEPKFREDIPGQPLTGFDWRITPEMLYWAVKFYHERYNKPIYITENGLSCRDWVSLDGKVHDPGRIDFLTRYIGQFKKAADEGIDVAGYFQWSLMDNFEWAEGYKERFGLIHVDFKTFKRTPKDSYYWYKEVIDSNGENISY